MIISSVSNLFGAREASSPLWNQVVVSSGNHFCINWGEGLIESIVALKMQKINIYFLVSNFIYKVKKLT